MLAARDIRVDLGGKAILDGVSLSAEAGQVLAILGPNGAGKSTLMKAMAGSLIPAHGTVELQDRPLASWPRKLLARTRAVLPQASILTFPFQVLEVVLLGRSPHQGRSTRARDIVIADSALSDCAAAHLADRIHTTLSGGEQQRVHLARVLAQIWPDRAGADWDGKVLLLDEPTSSLDIAHQHTTLAAARRLARRGATVVAILHDLNLAAMYADRICMMTRGGIVADGAPRDVMSRETIRAVFDLAATVTAHPNRDCLYVIPD